MKIRHPFLIQSAGLIGSWLIRAWMPTLRIEFDLCDSEIVPKKSPPRKYLFSLYHENMLLPTFLYRNCGVSILVSSHADGEIVHQIARRFGYGTIRGSSTRGGSKALYEMIRKGSRQHLVITPDGPRGPRRQVQNGIAMLAIATGMPIVPTSVEFRSGWRANSWDRFAIPKPFSRVCLITGPAILPPKPDEFFALKQFRRQIEEAMQEVTRRADHWRDHGQFLQEAYPQPIPIRKAG